MGALESVWRTMKPLLPTDMVSFISYFESTWVRTSTTSPIFSHDMWNQHDASLILIPRSSKHSRRVASWVPLNAVMFQPLHSGSFWTPSNLSKPSCRPEAATEEAPSTTRATSPQVDKLWPETAEYWSVWPETVETYSYVFIYLRL